MSAPSAPVAWAMLTPRKAWETLAPASSCESSPFTPSIGTAKPTPVKLSELELPVAIWSVMPTTCPRAFSTGPPELPGSMAASVWIASAMVKPLGA